MNTPGEHEGFVKELEKRLDAAIAGKPAALFSPPPEDDVATDVADESGGAPTTAAAA